MEKSVAGLAAWLHAAALTVYASSASVFRHFLKTLAGAERFPRVRIVRLGSEPVTAADFEAFRRHFVRGCIFINSLSSSETGTMTQLHLTHDDRVTESRLPVGRPAAGAEVLLLDDHGREAPAGATGEVVVRGRGLSPGYWRNDEIGRAHV